MDIVPSINVKVDLAAQFKNLKFDFGNLSNNVILVLGNIILIFSYPVP